MNVEIDRRLYYPHGRNRRTGQTSTLLARYFILNPISKCVFLKKLPIQILVFVISLAANAFGESQNWPGFRGPGATGVLEGHSLPTTWNADPAAENPEGVIWRASIPGLGHSSPVVWGDRIFVCTAIPEGKAAELMLGRGGQPTAADDARNHRWVILCFDKKPAKKCGSKPLGKACPGLPASH